MIKLQPADLSRFLNVALDRIPAQLALINGSVLNVFTGTIDKANVFIDQGFIAHVEYDDLTTVHADQIMDVSGKIIVPGFIDAHMHIESSMMTPRNFAATVIPWGTTTVVTDPHEIGNVYGVEGVKYMHDCSDDLPMRQLIDIPSCVPSVPGKENAGADFTASEIIELSKLDRVVGLAEVMDFLAVINGEKRMMDILEVAKDHGLYLQGHAPGLSGRALSAYIAAGPCTDHETTNGANAYEKFRAGMHIDARQSSMARNVPDIINALKDVRYKDNLNLCTDDRESDDLLHQGHMNHVIQKAIDCGLDPIDAIRCATYNNAREIKIDHLGAVAPGYTADLCLLDDIRVIQPSHVFFGGKLVAQDGKLVETIPVKEYELEKQNSVVIKPLSEDDFTIVPPIENGKTTVNVMAFTDTKNSLTYLEQMQLDVVNGTLVLDDPNLKFVAVVNRYPGNDNIALHVIRNFGLNHGAIASTVSHDCHNLVIVYDTPKNALVAANRIQTIGGGMVAVDHGEVLDELALPLAGLMSLLPAQELSKISAHMKQTYQGLGLVEPENPLLRIATLALPVIPEYKMSDMGLIEVNTKKIVPLFKG